MGRKLDRYLSGAGAAGRFRVEFEGYSIGAGRSNGRRYTGIIEAEDGREIGFDLHDSLEGLDEPGCSTVHDGGRASTVLDALAPRRREEYGTFRRLRPELVAAIRAADPNPRPEAAAAGRAEVPGMADIAAAAEAEGTPLAPVAMLVRAVRTCVECGSKVYGEYCTHCMEG